MYCNKKPLLILQYTQVQIIPSNIKIRKSSKDITIIIIFLFFLRSKYARGVFKGAERSRYNFTILFNT